MLNLVMNITSNIARNNCLTLLLVKLNHYVNEVTTSLSDQFIQHLFSRINNLKVENGVIKLSCNFGM